MDKPRAAVHGGTLVLKTLCFVKGIAFLSPWEYYTEAGLVWVFFFKEKHPQRWLVSGPQLGGHLHPQLHGGRLSLALQGQLQEKEARQKNQEVQEIPSRSIRVHRPTCCSQPVLV